MKQQRIAATVNGWFHYRYGFAMMLLVIFLYWSFNLKSIIVFISLIQTENNLTQNAIETIRIYLIGIGNIRVVWQECDHFLETSAIDDTRLHQILD